MINRLKEKMIQGEKTLGTLHEIGNATVIECLGYAGLDYVLIDSEHGPFGPESVQSFVRAAKLANITPLVRVKDSERNSILKMLDVGAMGLVIPNVQNVDEVKKIIEHGKYFPVGRRGVAPTSGSSFWYSDNASRGLESYFETSNHESLIIPQCETIGCLENIEEIVSLEGVDGIFVGPYDLSTALGKPGQIDDEDVRNAIQKVLDSCKNANKFAFIYSGTEQGIKEHFDQGFDSVTYSMDAIILTEAFKKLIANVKS